MNAITDVPGVLVGHHHRVGDGWATGTTVVLLPEGTVGGVDARGGAPGTRETDLLAPENLVSRVDAVCLSGGSAYGLAAADGVMRWLGERGRGFRVGPATHEVVPIVPAAVLFDLPRGAWGNRPDADFGYAACAAAAAGPVEQGSVGAGAGARVGSLKGGIGTASAEVGEITVGAVAAVNARGEVVDLSTGGFHAPGEPGEFPEPPGWAAQVSALPTDLNTTIGVVATDARLTKAECRRLAMSAQDGLARAIRPSHTLFDGDTVFSAATGTHAVAGPAALNALYIAAAAVFARAVAHGALAATTVGDLRSYRDVWASHGS
ncbi:P1 family peptidase [Actinokineospora auranticolor]|uniref:L-aminopeptidase/D-esterase-like protein n=1 Tax=Actinokineospora auranticolor TaxID=155976 RepID=A0A2S6GUL2_9PSEU|nr:P1 family peptidase [Actinokineospora auranticolor]PPK68935.1 L-aminopeptidase/D-esterase-like protein [Actinokineospora auranticolor]